MLREWTGLTLVTFVLFGGGLVSAQEPPKKEMQPPVTSSAVAGKMAGEETKPPEKNDVAPPVETRSGRFTCDLNIENHTPWRIGVYIDSRYWGTAGRYSTTIARDIVIGRTKAYVQADFTDGSTKYWGPEWFNCESYASYTWRLGQ